MFQLPNLYKHITFNISMENVFVVTTPLGNKENFAYYLMSFTKIKRTWCDRMKMDN